MHVDDVSVAYRPGLSVSGTECLEPGGGAAGATETVAAPVEETQEATPEEVATALPFPTLALPEEPTEQPTEGVSLPDGAAVPDAGRAGTAAGAVDGGADHRAAAGAGGSEHGRRRAGLAGRERLGADEEAAYGGAGLGLGDEHDQPGGRAGCARWTCGAWRVERSGAGARRGWSGVGSSASVQVSLDGSGRGSRSGRCAERPGNGSRSRSS
ncbi:MAG: hypothetical protein U0521_22385 [Anaerolineae bacterium]